MGIVSGHGEADIGVPHIVLGERNGETCDEATGWYLVAGRGQWRSEGDRESGHADIHRQAPRDGGTVGGPPAYIQSLSTGDGVQG